MGQSSSNSARVKAANARMERAMLQRALRKDPDTRVDPPRYEPAGVRAIFTEAYAIEQAEKAARRRRLLREAIARRIPAQNAGDSTTGLQMPKKAV